MKSEVLEKIAALNDEEKQLEITCINSLRCFTAALPEVGCSGHPGAPMGLAPVAHALWGYIMHYSPSNPEWWNRDRFVLSNGHACSLLYTLLHLTGYPISMDDLKRFRSLGSITPGHPERNLSVGIELTTGPLGQGIASAVGMAIAAAHLAEEFNKEDIELFDNYIYCICGDGCLQEGVSAEASSLAGHLELGRLIVIYDDNNTTIDGNTNLSFTENVETRYHSYGWHVQRLGNVDENYVAVIEAIESAKKQNTKPSLIIATTTIGYGSLKAGSAKTHGAALGLEDVKQVRKRFKLGQLGSELENDWNANVWSKYQTKYPRESAELTRRFHKRLPEDWESCLPKYSSSDKPKATRNLSGIYLNALAKILPELIGGSADLTDSNKTALEGTTDFSSESRIGRYIRFGVREHGMFAIVNGIYAYGFYRPFGATFLNFVTYGWGAIRLAALSHFGVLIIASHDSIELGEDGPTHQPIETLALLRSTPNMNCIRPADGNEVSAAYSMWLKNDRKPTIITLCRSDVPQIEGTSITKAQYGGYTISNFKYNGGKRIILAASGSELHLVVEAAQMITTNNKAIDIRVVSLPCWNRYLREDGRYQRNVVPEIRHREDSIIGAMYVEAGSTYGWDKFFDVDYSIGMKEFGASAPRPDCWKKFGFTTQNIIKNVNDVKN